MTKETKENLNYLFGIDEETLEKSKDIFPTLDLGKLEVGARLIIQFLESNPKKIKHKSKFSKGKEIESSIIPVTVIEVIRKSEEDLFSIPLDQKYTLWLSSKSLSLGIAKIWNEDNDLLGKKASITISTAEYKEFGENRCYIVQEIA